MWQYHPLLIIFQFGALISIGVAVYCVRRLQTHGWNLLVGSMGALAVFNIVFNVASTLKVASTTLDAKLLFYKLEFLGSAVNPSVAVVLALAYLGYDRWLSQGVIAVLVGIPAVVIPLIIANPGNVMIVDPHLISVDGIQAFEHRFPPLFVTYIAWGLGAMLLAGGLVLYGAVAGKVPTTPAVLVGVGLLAPVGVVGLKVFGVYPAGGQGIARTPVASTLTLALIAVAIGRYRLFDRLSAGRSRVLRVMADGYVLSDEDGRILDANASARSLLRGSSDRTLAGRRVQDFIPVEKPGVSEETTTYEQNGRVLHVRSSEIGDARPRARGYVFILRDITPLRAKQRALEASEARLRAMFEDAVPGIAVLDASRQIRTVNPSMEDLFRADASDLEQVRFDDLLAPDTIFEDADRFEGIIEGSDSSFTTEYRFQRADGTEMWGQTSVSRLPAQEGPGPQESRGPRLLAFVVDVTMRRQLEDRFRQSQRLEAVGTLTSGIAHEFNNLLHTARAYLELSIQDRPTDEKPWTFIDQAQGRLERSSELVEKLLTFAKDEAKSDDERFEVSEVTRQSLQLAESALSSRVSLRRDLQTSVAIHGDPAKIQQVVVNLVTNAGQVMDGQEEPPVLDVAVFPLTVDEHLASVHVGLSRGEYVCIRISDTGPGMNAEVQRNIFDPFFSTQEVGEGTGLGLAVAYGIVDAHDGEITVDSEPGRGTTFTVYLPAADCPGEEATTDEAPHAGDERSVGEGTASSATESTANSADSHVLVVARNPGLRERDHARLTDLGYTVTNVASASAAFDAAVGEDAARTTRSDLSSNRSAPDVDLILVGDLGPDTDELAFLQGLRRRGYREPIVVTSAYPARFTAESVQAASGTAFIGRPMDPSRLQHVLDDALRTGD